MDTLLSLASDYYTSLSPITRAALVELIKATVKDWIWPPVRDLIRRAWRRAALPPLRRWRRRLGASLRSALRAMPPMRTWPALPPAQRR